VAGESKNGEVRLMASEPLQHSDLYTACDMHEAELHALAGGVAAVLVMRCPGKPTENEDAAAVLALRNKRGVLAVADGFGGTPAGDEASRRAVTALAVAIAGAMEEGGLRAGILDGFERANQAVLEMGVGAATTLAVVEIEQGEVRPYHVGDSEILLIGQRGKVKYQTVAHSPVGYGVEAGLIEERAALNHADRHLVSNMVGAAEMRIDVGPRLVMAPRDTLLLASDGLFDNMHLSEIVEIVRKGRLVDVMAVLADRCRQRMMRTDGKQPCKPDDLTVIVYRRE
jgi:serine/threonine protein phosphatase PrpC